MPQYQIQAPNGQTYQIEGPDGASQDEVIQAVLAQHPDAATVSQPQSGFFPALQAGYKGLKGDIAALAGRTGLMDLQAAEAYKEQQEKEAQQTFQPTQESWGQAPWEHIKELAGGSLPYMAAPAAAGAAAMLLPEAAAAAPILGGLTTVGEAAAGTGAGLASLGQFTGSNLSRQMQEGKTLGQTNLGAAAAAAVPQAALDVVSMHMIPGIRGIFGQAGEKLSADAAQQMAQQGLSKVAKDYALATGKAMGTEGLTEAAQQVFERMQAGLSLTDPEARQEYFDNFLGGAVLGGVAAPFGRYVERGSQQRQQEAEQQKQAVQERQAAAQAEAEKRASPDYINNFVQDYDQRTQEFQDLKAKLKSPGKNATPEESFDYRQNKTRLEDLGRSLFADTAEYKRVKPLHAQQQEQERLAKLSPMEHFLGLPAETEAPAEAPAEERHYWDTDFTPKKPAVSTVTPLRQYANDRIALAQDQHPSPAPADYAAYLAKDVGHARALLEKKPNLIGLSAKENTQTYKALNEQLQPVLEQRRAEMEQQGEQFTAPVLPEDENKYNEIADYAQESKDRSDEESRHLDEQFVKALTTKAPAVEVSDDLKVNPRDQQQKDRAEALMQKADQHDQEYRAARAAREYPAASEALDRKRQVLSELGSLTEGGGDYVRKFIDTRRAQNDALAKLDDVTDQLRSGETLGGAQPETAASTEGTLTNQAGRLRSQLITNMLHEAAMDRRVNGKAALTHDEAVKAASGVYDAVNDWVERSKATNSRPEYEERVVQPAQMRGTKIIKPAVTERVETKAATQAISPAEIKHFKERINAIRRKLNEAPSGKVQREVPVLKQQFATTEAQKVAEARGETATTLSGELRRRTEYVRDKMAKLGPMRPAARDALNKAADVMDSGKATRGLLDSVEAVVDANLKRQEIKQVDIRAINDALAAMGPTAREKREAGQKELFPETDKDLGYIRMTPQNFANSPKMREVWGALDAARKLVERQKNPAYVERQKAKVAKAALAELDKIKAVEEKTSLARGQYDTRVAELFNEAYKRMDDALAEILDPEIKDTREALDKAKTTLEKERAELARIQKRVKDVLEQPEGKDRIELATYQQFRYEEKLGTIEDLEKKIKEHEADLENLMETRFETHDTAAAVLEAVSDKKVQMLRDRVVKLENKLADMRKEKTSTVEKGATTLKYPFAEQRRENELKAAKAELQTSERQQIEAGKEVKSQAQQLEAAWKNAFGTGRRHVVSAGDALRLDKIEKRLEEITQDAADLAIKAETKPLTKNQSEKQQALQDEYDALLKQRAHIKTKTDKVDSRQEEIDKARAQREAAEDRAHAASRNTEIKRLQLESVEEETAEVIDQLGAYEKLPNDANALKDMIDDENTTKKLKKQAEEKLALVDRITSLEAQRAAIEEGKPPRKQQAATVETSAKKGAATPLRTGQLKTLKDASEALKSEREFEGDYEQPDLRGLFRTTTKPGASLKEQNVAKIADQVTKGWARVPDIEVVKNEDGLPEAIRDQAKAQNKIGQIPGVFDPNTEKVYLVSDNLKDANDVAMTIAHEVAGHYGLRSLLGDQYSDTMQKLYDGNKLVQEKARAKMDEDPALSQDIAVEEVLADMAEQGPLNDGRIKSALRNMYHAIKQWFADKLGIKNMSDKEVQQLVANARRFVQEGVGEKGLIQKGKYVFHTKAAYANDDMKSVGQIADKFIAKQKPLNERVRAASGGWLGLETQYIDRFAPLERASKVMEPLKGSQMMYYARMYDQRMHFVSQSVTHGAPVIKEVTRKDGRIERLIEAEDGPSIHNTVNILKEATPHIGNGEAVNRIFTLYMSAIRAQDKGFNSLHFGDALTEADLKKAYDTVAANSDLKNILDRARDEYNEYNRNLLNFLVQTGAMSKEVARRLMANNDYIPWYRENNGVAEMVIGNETPVRIGNMATQPYLKELVGGDKPILDFLTSSVQNTNLLADMGLRNLSTKSAVFELMDIGAARIVKNAEGPNVVKFRDNGENKVAVIDGLEGVPGDLIVKGMEGIPTQLPAIVRAMSIPAKLLRKSVTSTPVWMAKQLFRDSLAAPIMTGADFTPVLGALKEIGSPAKKTLERRGIVGGQQLTGSTEDITKILRDLVGDKTHWMAGLAKIEAMGMEADALTRRAQYNSYIKQGLSEMEATVMSLEAMNFNKRGASPSIHWVNSMIPFFNAQIQGLNVLYKAARGKLPFNDRLKIQEKLLTRGAMLAASSIAYAIAMQDDEAYQNATPDQKYGNWFVRLPGVDEPIRIPVPFEVGYIFKALPEAIVNIMRSEHGGEEAMQALTQIVLQTIPGGSSYGVPQAVRPGIEGVLGKSFYTGRDILSRHEQEMMPAEQYRDNTSEIAKIIGKGADVSPIMLEHLVQGYTGTLGLAFLQAVSLPFSKTGPEAAVKRLSDMPVVGGSFQPNDAGGIINDMYNHMQDAKKVEATYKEMVGQGRQAEANELLQKHSNEMMQSQMADWFTSQMTSITQAERAIKAADMTPTEKRKELDEMRQIKIQLAKSVRESVDKTKPQ